jgi:hypothetical protein
VGAQGIAFEHAARDKRTLNDASARSVCFMFAEECLGEHSKQQHNKTTQRMTSDKGNLCQQTSNQPLLCGIWVIWGFSFPNCERLGSELASESRYSDSPRTKMICGQQISF